MLRIVVEEKELDKPSNCGMNLVPDRDPSKSSR
jgi:hypothetical protein